MITDMKARSEMAQLMRDFLNDDGQTWSVQDRLQSIADNTADATAKDIAWTLWWCLEDFCDHQVILKKETWDAIQRFLLVLVSGGQIVREGTLIKFHSEDAIAPFSSIVQVRSALLRAPGFRKQVYRRDLEQRHIFPWPLEANIPLPRWFNRIIQRLRRPGPRYRVIFSDSNHGPLML